MSGSLGQKKGGWMRKSILLTAVSLIAAISLVLPAHGGSEPASVKLKRKATLVDQGAAVIVDLKAACDPGLEVLEAHVSVSQEGVASDFGRFTPVCDGRKHRFQVRVSAFEGSAFRTGKAFASAFVLVQDPDTGETAQAQDSRQIRIRG
jgi:hypothetical protein